MSSPSISSINPSSGSVLYDILVTISGSNFTSMAQVYVNSVLVDSTFINDTTLTIIMQHSHVILPVDIFVIVDAISSNVLTYTYLPDMKYICPSEINDLNEHIVIHGVGLTENMEVYFNQTLCDSTYKNHKVIYKIDNQIINPKKSLD